MRSANRPAVWSDTQVRTHVWASGQRMYYELRYVVKQSHRSKDGQLQGRCFDLKGQ